ncbi:cell division protein ZapA [Weissella kandleri]|uniref:cell division protein ZapA n=1 Tax=Weissella kandleri TaxID=1616 RepID=UPI00387E9A42
MAAMQRFQGKILGKTYTLTTNENQAHMEAVFNLANQQLNDLKNKNPKLSASDALVLVAINALSDQINMQKAAEEHV